MPCAPNLPPQKIWGHVQSACTVLFLQRSEKTTPPTCFIFIFLLAQFFPPFFNSTFAIFFQYETNMYTCILLLHSLSLQYHAFYIATAVPFF